MDETSLLPGVGMPSRGFSLVEMVTVMSCLAVLTAIGTLMFKRYDLNFRVEAQTRLILTELMKARMNAISQHRVTRVKLYPDRFEVYSSGIDLEDGAGPVMVQGLNFPLTNNFNGGGGGVVLVEFKETGLTSSWGASCVDAEGAQPALDSIVISATSIRSGVKGKGNECSSQNITIK